MFVDSIDSSVAETILSYLHSSTGSMAVAQLRVLGGAMARIPADATAFAHRASKIMVNVAALYENPDEQPTHEAWVTEFAAALRQNDAGRVRQFSWYGGRIKCARSVSWQHLEPAGRDQGSL